MFAVNNVMINGLIVICISVTNNIFIPLSIYLRMPMDIFSKEIFFASLCLVFSLFCFVFSLKCFGRAYNSSVSYRQCLSSIYESNGKCPSHKYPFTYEYFKTYWKLILSSCQQDKSRLSIC